MVKRNLAILFVLAMVFTLAACEHFSRNSYRALAVSASTYQISKATAQELYDTGKLNDAQKDKLNSLARVWRVAYHAAIDGLEMYDKGLQEAENVSAMLDKLSEILGAIQMLVEQGDL